MDLVRFELFKLNRRLVFIIAFLTLLVFPLLLKTLSHFDYVERQVPEGAFVEQNQLYIIRFATLYVFVPVWIVVIIGSEFKNGFAQRLMFYRSRFFYFKTKTIWCVFVSFIYSLLSIFTLWLCLSTIGYEFDYINFKFYTLFGIQCFITFLLLSLVLMCLVFIVKDIVISFVIYFGWHMVEGVLVMVISKVFNLKLYLLPLQLHTVFYIRKDKNNKESLINIFQYSNENIFALLVVMLLVLVTFWHFNRVNLKPLSD